MFDVISIGSATRDVLMQSEGFEVRDHSDSPTGVEQCFPLGSKIEIKDMVFTTGGGGTNAVVTFARQGFNSAFVGVVGTDFNGEEVIAELNKEKVNTDLIQRHKEGTTAYSVILVHPTGERTILSYKGEGQHFDVKVVPFEKLESKWFFLDSLGGHYDLFESLVKHAKEKSIKIASNPGGKELAHGLEKLKPFFAEMDILITNREEGAGLLGRKYDDWDGILDELKSYTKGIVVVSDGHNGVKVKDTEGHVYTAGVPDSPVVERTGAGDAFSSGFVCEYIRSGSIEKAIQFATANASSVVTRFGGKAGILEKDDWGQWPLVEVIKK